MESDDDGDKGKKNYDTVTNKKLCATCANSDVTIPLQQMEENRTPQNNLNSIKLSIENGFDGDKRRYDGAKRNRKSSIENGHDGDKNTFVNGKGKQKMIAQKSSIENGHDGDKNTFLNGRGKQKMIAQKSSIENGHDEDKNTFLNGGGKQNFNSLNSSVGNGYVGDRNIFANDGDKQSFVNGVNKKSCVNGDKNVCVNGTFEKKSSNTVQNSDSTNSFQQTLMNVDVIMMESVELRKSELVNKLSNSPNARSDDENGENFENGSKNGFDNGTYDDVFHCIPSCSKDKELSIQESILQSKSELVSKLNSQKSNTNTDEVKNGHDTSACISSCDITCSSKETVSCKSNEQTLFKACRQGNVDLVRYLLTSSDSGVDANMTDEEGWSCLHETSIRNCQFTPITELLLQNGANPNLKDKKGETPLHGAVLFHLVDTIKLLLKYNADFNISNNQKVSPLKLATYLKDNEILLLFGVTLSEDKNIVKKKKKKKKRNSYKDFRLPASTSPSILKKRRASDEPTGVKPRSKKRINFSL